MVFPGFASPLELTVGGIMGRWEAAGHFLANAENGQRLAGFGRS